MIQSPEAMKVWKETQAVFDEHPEGPFADTDAADVAAASVIESALQKARDEEREAVVAWLRNCTDGAPVQEGRVMSSRLEEALARAVDMVKAMTPAEKAEMIRKQRESWIRAFEPCEHGEVDFEQCGKCWEKYT